ncbi:hypothetical protein BHM04_01375 [Macrococcus sp. IME1552]|nr:Z1 domain-containing protein [Macrococcus sp. IME1552]ATD29897.1 hypothetical protein BHM04_01375 [Macrococcus sp. IME1552]
MKFDDLKYDRLITFIENLYLNEDYSWTQIKDYLNEDDEDTPEDVLKQIKKFYGLRNETFTIENWYEIVDEVSKRHTDHEVVKLGSTVKNNAIISTEALSCWQQYKSKLKNNGLSEKSIFNIQNSSFEILKNLSMTTEETGPVKGLVVGNVQSGKTANMAGLIAMAADNGFNFFIVLSGVIENLRRQTTERLFNDLQTAGNSKFKWNVIHNPSINDGIVNHDISKFDLGTNKYDRYLTVTLKNKTRLEKLIKWIKQDKNKAKQLKILIIDDEADQASVNTNKIEDENPTTINNLIKELVNSQTFGGMNYISYTATPYANVLNEVDKQSLYPKDFIILLEESEDYIGPKQIFGAEEPEMNPPVEIVRRISPEDVETVKNIQNGEIEDIPQSMKDAINWFLLSVSAMRSLSYKKPISMLIHTSFRVIHHEILSKVIEKYLLEIRDNFDSYESVLKKQYENEMKEFNRDIFLQGMHLYSSKEFVPEYPKWSTVLDQLKFLILEQSKNDYINHVQIDESGLPQFNKGIHLAIDNSSSTSDGKNVRLIYPTKKDEINIAPAFIVIGGNTLSRGLTIEGLVSTFFLRTTKQADTLMQMGRWFGYRKKYEVFPRVWLEDVAIERFQFLSQMNEELKDVISEYATKGFSPSAIAPRIKNSPDYNLIKITSNNKMQSATTIEFDFNGYSAQTIYFENDIEKLLSNLKLTSEFLNSLETPELKGENRLLWRNVNNQKVVDFLNEFNIYKDDMKMSSIPSLIDWLKKNDTVFEGWNIILSSIGNVKNEPVDDMWNIHGMSPKSVVRTKFKDRSTENIANIGVLRAPKDLLIDVEGLTDDEIKNIKSKDINIVRETNGLGNTPQLIIYKIDKGAEPYEKGNRINLDFPEDLIGVNISIPGATRNKNTAKTIQAKLKIEEFNDEEFFDDED